MANKNSTTKKTQRVAPEIKKDLVLPKTEQNSEAKAPKKKISLFFPLVVALILIAGFLFFSKHKSIIFAGKVNGQYIYIWDLNSKLQSAYGSKTLDNLIVESLIKTEFKKQKIVVSDADINKEISAIEKTLGGTSLNDALIQNGMTLALLKDQLYFKVGFEKFFADKLIITDDEIAKFIADNGSQLTAADDAGKKDEAKANLKEQKLSELEQAFVSDLQAKAKIQKYL